MMIEEGSFRAQVYYLVAAIPYGHVATYGMIAQLAGSPRAARHVGAILKNLPEGSTLPWHRVVNRMGKISLTGTDLLRQKKALQAEGVQFNRNNSIELDAYLWRL